MLCTINLTGSQVANQQLVPTKVIERQKAAVAVVVDVWSLVYANKARIYSVGRREVRQYARQDIDILAWEEIYVVTSFDGVYNVP